MNNEQPQICEQKTIGKSGYEYVIVAKCSKCGKTLIKSNKILGKKNFKEHWNQAVLSFPLTGIKCDCNESKTLNFDVDYTIERTNSRGELEKFTPQQLGLKTNL